jgi:hypothetical protein
MAHNEFVLSTLYIPPDSNHEAFLNRARTSRHWLAVGQATVCTSSYIVHMRLSLLSNLLMTAEIFKGILHDIYLAHWPVYTAIQGIKVLF